MPTSASPHPFLIVCDLRTGSTLLTTSLDRHPFIRCLGELFHSEDHADNQIQRADRHALTARELVAAGLDAPPGHAGGFRAMVYQPDTAARPQWSGVWEALAECEGLRVIYLRREDPLAQYVSYRVAERTGHFHPPPDDPALEAGNRPILHVEPGELNAWIEERASLYARCRTQLAGKPTLETSYDALAEHWDAEIHRIQRFIGVQPHRLTQRKRKQEQRPLAEVVSNYEALRQSEIRHDG